LRRVASSFALFTRGRRHILVLGHRIDVVANGSRTAPRIAAASARGVAEQRGGRAARLEQRLERAPRCVAGQAVGVLLKIGVVVPFGDFAVVIVVVANFGEFNVVEFLVQFLVQEFLKARLDRGDAGVG
jgi:hypothetical protein